MPIVTIRPAQTSEVEALGQLAFAAKAHWGYSAKDMERWAPDLRTPPETIGAWPTLAAEADGVILGFTQLSPLSDPWELVSLWVHPAHMGRGVGTLLLRQAVSTARASGQRRIHIDADPNALAFYLACGATQVGAVAAPIDSDAKRVRPQLRMAVR